MVLPRKAGVILEEATWEETSSLIFRSCYAGNFGLLGSLKTDPEKTRVTTLCIEGRPLGWGGGLGHVHGKAEPAVITAKFSCRSAPGTIRRTYMFC